MDGLIDWLTDRPSEQASEQTNRFRLERRCLRCCVCSVSVRSVCALCVCVCEVQQFKVHTWVAPRLMPSINLRVPVCVRVCAKVTSFNSLLAPFTAPFNRMANRSRRWMANPVSPQLPHQQQQQKQSDNIAMGSSIKMWVAIDLRQLSIDALTLCAAKIT